MKYLVILILAFGLLGCEVPDLANKVSRSASSNNDDATIKKSFDLFGPPPGDRSSHSKTEYNASGLTFTRTVYAGLESSLLDRYFKKTEKTGPIGYSYTNKGYQLISVGNPANTRSEVELYLREIANISYNKISLEFFAYDIKQQSDSDSRKMAPFQLLFGVKNNQTHLAPDARDYSFKVAIQEGKNSDYLSLAIAKPNTTLATEENLKSKLYEKEDGWAKNMGAKVRIDLTSNSTGALVEIFIKNEKRLEQSVPLDSFSQVNNLVLSAMQSSTSNGLMVVAPKAYYSDVGISKASKPKNSKKMVAYIETNDHNILNIGKLLLKDTKVPVYDAVIMFASNLQWDTENLEPFVCYNRELAPIYNNPKGYIAPLRNQGIEVFMALLPHHDGIGFHNFMSANAAEEFVENQLSPITKSLGIDGWLLNNEWWKKSAITYVDNPSKSSQRPRARTLSTYWFLKAFKKYMPNKKIAVYDIQDDIKLAFDTAKSNERPSDYVDYVWNYTFYGDNVLNLSDANRDGSTGGYFIVGSDEQEKYGWLTTWDLTFTTSTGSSKYDETTNGFSYLNRLTKEFYGEETIFNGSVIPRPTPGTETCKQ